MVPVGFGRGSPGVQRLRQPSPSSHAFLSLVSDACCVLDQQERVRVLVVDDEPSIVDVISIALRHHGFGVEAADSGREALDWVRKWRPVSYTHLRAHETDSYLVCRL